MSTGLPVAIIGAGPAGLAAAAHLAERGESFIIFERGTSVGHSIRQWRHVRLFSPWRFNVDTAAARLLGNCGWRAPEPEYLPTGDELLRDYLVPLSKHPAIAARLQLDAQVVTIGRKNMDKVLTAGRERQPFEIRLTDGTRTEARAVIDASGTWFSPNPLGSDGNPALGEAEHSALISYGIPDLLGDERTRFTGQRVLVVGAGHSAINNIVNLLELRRLNPKTRIQWAWRRETIATLFGAGTADALPARAALGARARAAVEAGEVEVLAPLRIFGLCGAADGIAVAGDLAGRSFSTIADQVIVATGFRPDVAPLREVRLRLHPSLEAVEALAPLIDPAVHSCGSVPLHGYRELSHPDPDFFIIGMKSYGRAPTFLMATGYEQARSVAAALAGDFDAAGRVELEPPKTRRCDLEIPSDCPPRKATAARGRAGCRPTGTRLTG